MLSFEELLPKVQLEPHMKELVDASYAFNKAKEEAEHKRQEEELEKERRLRGEAENNARRARQRTRVAGMVSVVAIVLAVVAFLSFQDAKSAKIQAEEKTVEAEKAEATAKEEEKLADAARQEAQDSARVAKEQRQLAQEEAQKADDALKKQRLAQLDAALADASQRTGEKQYNAALQSYRNALASALPHEVPPIRRKMEQCQEAKREYEFTISREKGLRLAEAGECGAARRYLEEASEIKPGDEALKKALEKCR